MSDSAPFRAIRRARTAVLLGLCLGLLSPLIHAQRAEPIHHEVPPPSYTVQSGDTLASISQAMGVPVQEWAKVASYNRLSRNLQVPAPGTVLRVPLQLLPHKPATALLIQTVGEVRVNGRIVEAGIRLRESTRIQTRNDSSAVIELDDGSRIQIMPRTVADIVENRHHPAPDAASGRVVNWFTSKLRLVQGALDSSIDLIAPRAKPLEVETADSLIGVRGTQFRVTSAQAQPDRIEVLRGAVSHTDRKSRTEIALQAGEGLVMDAAQPEARQVSRLLPAPQLGSQTTTLSLPHAIWSFPAQADAHAYRVIVSRDPGFETVVSSELLQLPHKDMGSLGDGLWHVRVRSVDRHGLEGFDADTSLLVQAAPLSLSRCMWRAAGNRYCNGALCC